MRGWLYTSLAGGRGGGAGGHATGRSQDLDQETIFVARGKFHGRRNVPDRLEDAVQDVVEATADYFAAQPYSIAISVAGEEDIGVTIRVYGDESVNVLAFTRRPVPPAEGIPSAPEPLYNDGDM